MHIVTHDGPFHADDCFAVAVLTAVFFVESVIRSRDEDDFEPADFLVDVGAEYDPGEGKFDHHQRGGAGCRPCGTPYASAGLVWDEFGLQYVEHILERDDVSLPLEMKTEIVDLVDDQLIRGIDATDTGNPLGSLPEGVMTVSRDIALLNPTYLEQSRFSTDSDEQFMVAVRRATETLDRVIWSAYAQVSAQVEVEQAPRAVGERVLVLERFVPWSDQDVIHEDEDLLYVVFKADTGTWMCQQVPKEPGSFEGRKPLPEAWAGLRDDEFADATSVASAVFCHPGRFIAGAATREGALELARQAIEA